MWALALASAYAGMHGPFEPEAALEADVPVTACSDQYPYALVQLPDRPSLYRRSDPTRSWATPELVELIVEASAQVALDYPDSDPLTVGDLSMEHGGPFPPHRYHSDGRSADLGLFIDGRQPRNGFVDTLPSQLDVERQWVLIEAFLSTGRVEHILLDQALIDRLVGWLRATERLSEAELARIFPAADADRLWARTGIVRSAARHRDHMHVRLRCT
jgi:murein endopeptidase